MSLGAVGFIEHSIQICPILSNSLQLTSHIGTRNIAFSKWCSELSERILWERQRTTSCVLLRKAYSLTHADPRSGEVTRDVMWPYIISPGLQKVSTDDPTGESLSSICSVHTVLRTTLYKFGEICVLTRIVFAFRCTGQSAPVNNLRLESWRY